MAHEGTNDTSATSPTPQLHVNLQLSLPGQMLMGIQGYRTQNSCLTTMSFLRSVTK